MNTIIQRKDGKTYDLESLFIKTLDFDVSAPSPRHSFETLEGRHGVIDQGTVYDTREINCSFYMAAVDFPDYVLLRNEVFKMFDSLESFYIIDSREPGKRFLVKTDRPYRISQTGRYGFFDVSFVGLTGLAESIGTTLNPFTVDTDLWQVGQGLLTEDISYIHSTNEFRIYNAGDVEIDPREHFLEIKLKGETFYPQIDNLTTGDSWQGWIETSTNQTLVLSGVKSEVGYMSVFADTNRELIRLAPGWNDFRVSGTYGEFEIKFDFRFLYK